MIALNDADCVLKIVVPTFVLVVAAGWWGHYKFLTEFHGTQFIVAIAAIPLILILIILIIIIIVIVVAHQIRKGVQMGLYFDQGCRGQVHARAKRRMVVVRQQ